MHLCIQTRWIPCETVEYSLPGHWTLTLSMLTRFGDTSIEKWWIYDCSWRTMRCNTRGKISRGVCGERDGKSKSLWKYIIVINKMLQFLGPLQSQLRARTSSRLLALHRTSSGLAAIWRVNLLLQDFACVCNFSPKIFLSNKSNCKKIIL